MPPNAPIFLLGLVVGTVLLAIGLLLGFWFGRKSGATGDVVDRQQFLTFLRNLSNWTNEFSGDVTRYQSQLSNINERAIGSKAAGSQEVVDLLAQIMTANRQLQERLESAEQRLESQTDQISNYLTEARTDGLTGLFNRRAFDKATDELFADWQKKEQAFSLGLIDIDHFKQINDTYGHPAGDAVLKHISNTLQTELHQSVCVARYGGEEFAMLTLASAEDAAAALDQLRSAVCKLEIKHDDQLIAVTLSAGVSRIEPDDKIGKLVRRADEALYAAKLGGRNRVYLHDGAICRLITQILPEALVPQTQSSEPLTRAQAQAADETLARQTRVQERLKRIVEEESQRIAERT
ncbi:MAG: GGDEF domain-containing protein [Pirellulaceae bacterium]